MATSAVLLENLTHHYPGEIHPVLAIDALEIEEGSSVALIGASGAGKSTLLRLLDGRLRGWRGQATVLTHALSPSTAPPRIWRSETGYVFQEFALIESASVKQNVLNGRLGRTHAGLSLIGRFSIADETAAEAAMRDVGITELADRRADRLSGGQRQRVAIARVLAQEPRLILADEPVSNLDPKNSEVILALLRECAAKRGATLILTSHQPRLVAPFVDRFIALDSGKVMFDGVTEDVDEAVLASIYSKASRENHNEAAE